MRAGPVLLHFFVLLLATTASLLMLGWSERAFPAVPTPPGVVARMAPQCLTLAVADSIASWISVPRAVRLTTSPARRVPKLLSQTAWYDVVVVVPSVPSNYVGYRADHPPRWRPAGVDSIDLVVPEWPVAVVMRISSHGDTRGGRLVGYGDSAEVLPFNGAFHVISWPPVFSVRATRIPCSGST